MNERRANKRYRQVFLPGLVRYRGRNVACLVRDMSDEGLGLSLTEPIPIGATVRISWGDFPPITGKIAWQRDDRIGIETPFSPFAVESEKPYRAVRIDTAFPATLFVNAQGRSAKVLNVSNRGMSVSTDEDLPVGSLVSLVIGRRSFAGCTVRWSREGASGLALPEPLPVRVLNSILAESEPECDVAMTSANVSQPVTPCGELRVA